MSSLSLEVYKQAALGYFRDGFCPGGWSELHDLGALSSLDAMILK